jgi:hypothetical protein
MRVLLVCIVLNVACGSGSAGGGVASDGGGGVAGAGGGGVAVEGDGGVAGDADGGVVDAPVPAPAGYPEIVGVYDLTASITSFDPAWGEDLTGYRYIAVLTLHEELGPPWTRGTYSDFHLVGPGGDSTDVAPGFVTGYLGFGTVVLEVRNDHWQGLTLLVGTVAPGFIDGSFGCCGHIGGTFTAERR